MIKRRKNTLFILWEFNGSLFKQSLIPFIQVCFVPIWLKLAMRFWRRRILNFVNVFSLFRYYLALKKGGAFIWTNLSPHYPRIHCAIFGWNWPCGSGEDFLISWMYFRNFVIISPWKRAGTFIWTILKPLHRRMHCFDFGWNWPCGSGGEDFWISSMYFRYFVIISP